jgi:hypothetical protein
VVGSFHLHRSFGIGLCISADAIGARVGGAISSSVGVIHSCGIDSVVVGSGIQNELGENETSLKRFNNTWLQLPLQARGGNVRIAAKR